LSKHQQKLLPEEILINVSEDEAPIPFEKVSKRISQMKSGEYIRMLHRKKPLPLIQILQENGLKCIIMQGQHTAWEIIIWKKQDLVTNNYCSTHFS